MWQGRNDPRSARWRLGQRTPRPGESPSRRRVARRGNPGTHSRRSRRGGDQTVSQVSLPKAPARLPDGPALPSRGFEEGGWGDRPNSSDDIAATERRRAVMHDVKCHSAGDALEWMRDQYQNDGRILFRGQTRSWPTFKPRLLATTKTPDEQCGVSAAHSTVERMRFQDTESSRDIIDSAYYCITSFDPRLSTSRELLRLHSTLR